MNEKLNIAKTDAKMLIKKSKSDYIAKNYQKLISQNDDKIQKRYYPFIDRKTSSFAYWDQQKDSLNLGVKEEILINILASANQIYPSIYPVLGIDFNVHMNERIDLENETFNLFVPTKFMLMNKTEEFLNPYNSFPHIYRVLSNLIPKYRERKRFLNWLAWIMQTREKQQTAWVFKGAQGSGKNIFLEHVLKILLGKQQAIKVENQELHSDYNGWLQNSILIAFNEVSYDKRSESMIKSKVKSIVTDPDVTINEKFIRAFSITNYVNCLFFSNENIPVFIENQDRRMSIVVTGPNLRTYEWFAKDPEGFLKNMEGEVFHFAQFLMNWNYDQNAAKTPIENAEKNMVITACMNNYEEFASHLKTNDYEWFNDNASTSELIGYFDVNKYRINGKIKKKDAIELFNKLYTNQIVSEVVLGKKLKLYGISSKKMTDDLDGQRKYYYTWENSTRTIVQVNSAIVQDEQSL